MTVKKTAMSPHFSCYLYIFFVEIGQFSLQYPQMRTQMVDNFPFGVFATDNAIAFN